MSPANGGTCPNCGALPAEFPCSLTGCSLVEHVIINNALWWISYCFLILLTKQSEEWCCRLLTLVHGCVVSATAICDIIFNESAIVFKNSSLSETQRSYLSFMLSYFIFDFCWFHFFGNEAWVIYVHHCTSILIIVKMLVGEYGGGGISYAVAGLEFTNPYLQLRWFLRTHGYLNTPLHTAVELWFFILFSLLRSFGGSILLYYVILFSKIDMGMKMAFLSIYLISLALQWQIITYWKTKYWRGNRRNFNRSKVSISQYFQRKTLDRVDSEDSTSDVDDINTTKNSTASGTEILNEFPESDSAKVETRVETLSSNESDGASTSIGDGGKAKSEQE